MCLVLENRNNNNIIDSPMRPLLSTFSFYSGAAISKDFHRQWDETTLYRILGMNCTLAIMWDYVLSQEYDFFALISNKLQKKKEAL